MPVPAKRDPEAGPGRPKADLATPRPDAPGETRDATEFTGGGRSRAGWSKERVGCNLSSQSLYMEVEPELEAGEAAGWRWPVRSWGVAVLVILYFRSTSRGSWAIVPVRR